MSQWPVISSPAGQFLETSCLRHRQPPFRIAGRVYYTQLDLSRFGPTLVVWARVYLMTAESWVTAEQVADHLGVVKDTVYRWRERKGLPAHKIGRLWKFQLSEVDEWVRAAGADESGSYKGPKP